MAKPSIPNSHTNIFTRIPKTVEKKWTTKRVSIRANTELQSDDIKSEESMIESVTLTVRFNPLLQHKIEHLTEEDDISFDLIDGWQETRKEWAELEESVEAAILNFTERNVRRAASEGTAVIETLGKKNISYICASTKDSGKQLNRESNRILNMSSNRSSRSSTIHPSDSASHVSRQSNSYANSSVSKKTVKSKLPFLSYAAGFR
jgi:hypothetical protein